MKKLIFLFFLFFVFFLIYFKMNNVKNEFLPVNLLSEHVCSNDGMTIVDYKGPKAQIIWEDGSISFYCEVRESFFVWLDPIKRKKIKSFFVQDFSFIKWGSYLSNWVDASVVFYVIDSSKYGAMGVSYVPFTDIICAELFFTKYGGVIVNFNDITIDILEKSNEILQDRMINFCNN